MNDSADEFIVGKDTLGVVHSEVSDSVDEFIVGRDTLGVVMVVEMAGRTDGARLTGGCSGFLGSDAPRPPRSRREDGTTGTVETAGDLTEILGSSGNLVGY